jgi:hypothetical protein
MLFSLGVIANALLGCCLMCVVSNLRPTCQQQWLRLPKLRSLVTAFFYRRHAPVLTCFVITRTEVKNLQQLHGG